MPLYVYDNWSAYDELSDNVPLTEALAMRQFDELLRLRDRGAKFDAYLMDAYWYDPGGAFRTWRADRWPNGPDQWFARCDSSGILPGLWFPANTAFELEARQEWQDSLASDGWGFCLFEGGFLAGFMEALRYWYGRGVRVFKFDFADFGAASDATKKLLLPSEIRSRNVAAYRAALKEFRRDCPSAVLLAYNGFEEAEYMTWTDRPIRRVVDAAWLEVFDAVYCGDPRPADIPLPDFFRSVDIYTDQMIRHLHETGFPLSAIDDCAFMMGTTGTCYKRGKEGWKASLVLSLSRGGNVHMTLGDLSQFSDEDGAWIGAAQRHFEGSGAPRPFGGIPGRGEAYGYETETGVTAANPSLCVAQIELPPGSDFRVAFQSGAAKLEGSRLKLGPMAVVLATNSVAGLGELAPTPWDEYEEILCTWTGPGRSLGTTLIVPFGKDLHILFEQRDSKGLAVRTSDGSPIPATLRIDAMQNQRPLVMHRPDDRIIWSGLSWAYAIVRADSITASEPVQIEIGTGDPHAVRITPRVFAVSQSDQLA